MKRAFANFQPDLNLRNPLVLDELVGVLDFWFSDKAVITVEITHVD